MSTLTKYAGYAGSGSLQYAAFAIEKMVSHKWTHNYYSSFPLLQLIKDNTLSKVVRSQGVGGRRVLCPIILDAHTAATGVAASSALVDQTLLRAVGHSQAEYFWTTYVNNVALSVQEARLVKSGSLSVRGSIIQALAVQMVNSFFEQMATDMATNTVDSETKLLGIRYALATGSAALGGLDQGGVGNDFWKSNVTAVGGALTASILTDQMNARMSTFMDGETLDVIVASAPAASPDVYSKIEQFVTQQRTIVSDKDKANYGVNTFRFKDAMVIRDHRATGGELYGICSNSWFYAGDTEPQKANADPYQVKGLPTEVSIYSLIASWGTNAPAKNFKLTGITG